MTVAALKAAAAMAAVTAPGRRGGECSDDGAATRDRKGGGAAAANVAQELPAQWQPRGEPVAIHSLQSVVLIVFSGILD